MKVLRLTAAGLAILGGLAASTVAIPGGSGRANAAGMCPFVGSLFCVVEKTGFKHPAWTNACLAKMQGLKILHPGAC